MDYSQLPPQLLSIFKRFEALAVACERVPGPEAVQAVRSYFAHIGSVDQQLIDLTQFYWRLTSGLMNVLANDPETLMEVGRFIDEVFQLFKQAPFRLIFSVSEVLDSGKSYYSHFEAPVHPYAPYGYPLKLYTPAPGEECMVSYPNSVTGAWAGCLLLEGDDRQCRVQIQGLEEQTLSNVVFAPLVPQNDQRQWRLALQAGMIVDAKTKEGVWYDSTIVSRTENKVRVGFRVPALDGWSGLSQLYDEEVDLFSERLQPPQRMLLKGMVEEKDRAVDDSADFLSLLYLNTQQGIAVMRNSKTGEFARRVNQFHQEQGFENMLRLMKSEGFNKVLLLNFLHVFRNCWAFFHRQVAFTLEAQVADFAVKFLLDKSRPKALGVHQNIDYCIKFVQSIIRRSHTRRQKDELIANLAKDSALILFGENALDRTISGLKVLNDAIQLVAWDSGLTQSMKQWLNEQGIFQKIFNFDSHHELISRSQSFLDYLLKHNLLEDSAVQHLYSTALRMDEHSRNAVLKLLAESSTYMHTDLLVALARLIRMTPVSEASENQLQLLSSLSKHSVRSKSFVLSSIQYFCQVAGQDRKTKKKATDLLGGLITQLREEERLLVLGEILEGGDKNPTPEELQICTMIVKGNESQKDSMERICLRMLSGDLLPKLINSLNANSSKQLLVFITLVYRQANTLPPTQVLFQKLGRSQMFIHWLAKQTIDEAEKARILFPPQQSSIKEYGQYSQPGVKALIELFKQVNKASGSLHFCEFEVSTEYGVITAGKSENGIIGPKNKPDSTAKTVVLNRAASLDDLVGLPHFMDLLIHCKRDRLVRNFLISIFQHPYPGNGKALRQMIQALFAQLPGILRKCLALSEEAETRRSYFQRVLYFFGNLIGETEAGGRGDFQPYSSFINRKIMKISIHNEVTSISPSFINLQLDGNTTMLQLRMKLGAMLQQPYQILELAFGATKYRPCKNGQTVSEALFDKATIKATKSVRYVTLCREFGSRTGDDKLMSREEFKKYLEDMKLPEVFCGLLFPNEFYLATKAEFVQLIESLMDDWSFELRNFRAREILSADKVQQPLLEILALLHSDSKYHLFQFIHRLAPLPGCCAALEADPNSLFALSQEMRSYCLPLLVRLVEQGKCNDLDWARLFEAVSDFLLNQLSDRHQYQYHQCISAIECISNALVSYLKLEDMKHYPCDKGTPQAAALSAYYDREYLCFREEGPIRSNFQRSLVKFDLFGAVLSSFLKEVNCNKVIAVQKIFRRMGRLLVFAGLARPALDLEGSLGHFMQLINSPNEVIKCIAGKSLAVLCKSNPLQTILSLFSSQEHTLGKGFSTLIYDLLSESAVVDVPILHEVYQKAVAHLQRADSEDTQVGSWLSVLECLLKKEGFLLPMEQAERVVRLVFGRFLFYEAEENVLALQVTKEEVQKPVLPHYILSRKSTQRKSCFEVCSTLGRQSADVAHFMLARMNELALKYESCQPKRLQPKEVGVGIQNLGCICYLSAMMQLFMRVQEFRGAVLGLSGLPGERPQVRQISKMFHYLQFSSRHQYNPQSFLNSFSPPINPSFQQDTSEFLAYLFDLLDKQAEKTAYSHFLEQIFGGRTATQMICGGCRAVRSIEQSFFSYGVGVKGRDNLDQAIAGMQQGEVISDCFCESCGRKQDTLRRTLIKELPNYLLISLQRIVFDMDTFVNVKIHTKLEFPTSLDLQPYTVEGHELRERLGKDFDRAEKELKLHGKGESHYKYELSGVIVHSGRAEQGHYYTFVCRGKDWLKLDDSKVEKEHTFVVLKECYGGTTITSEWGMLGQQSANAYVLLYQRVCKTEGPAQGEFSSQLCTEVFRDNHRFLHEYLIFSKTHQYFFQYFLKFAEITWPADPVRVREQVNTVIVKFLHRVDSSTLVHKFVKLSSEIMRKAQLQEGFMIIKSLSALLQPDANYRLAVTDLFVEEIVFILSAQPLRTQYETELVGFVVNLCSELLKKTCKVNRTDVLFRLLNGIGHLPPIKQLSYERELVVDLLMFYKNGFSGDFKDAIAFISKSLDGREPTEREDRLLRDQPTFAKLLKEKQNAEHLALMQCAMCKSNLQSSREIAGTILQGMSSSILWEEIGSYANLTQKFLLIEDQFSQLRLEMVLGFPQWTAPADRKFATQVIRYTSADLDLKHPSLLASLYENRKYVCYGLKIIEFLVSLCQQSQRIRDYLYACPGVFLTETSLVGWFQGYVVGEVSRINELKMSYQNLDHNLALTLITTALQKCPPRPGSFVIGKELPISSRTFCSTTLPMVTIESTQVMVTFSQDFEKLRHLDQKDQRSIELRSPLFQLFSPADQFRMGVEKEYDVRVEKGPIVLLYTLVNKSERRLAFTLLKNNDCIWSPSRIELSLDSRSSQQIRLILANSRFEWPAAEELFRIIVNGEVSAAPAAMQPQTKPEEGSKEMMAEEAYIDCKTCTLTNPACLSRCEACDSPLY